jgi:hypothetical protein
MAVATCLLGVCDSDIECIIPQTGCSSSLINYMNS